MIICPNFENNRNLVGIKARVELVAENCQNNSPAFKVKTLQIVRVYNVISPHHKVKIVKLSEIIEDKNYKFEDYKEAIEDLILGIKYIQDNNMIELPLFDSTKESFLQYSHNLCFFIINAINQYMAIDNAAFLFGNIIQRLRKARYKLLKYLEFKAAEDQKKQKNDPIFHDKLITGKILPLIMLEKRNEKALIPCTVNNSITVPLSVKEQLIKYRKISRVSEKHVVLIAQTDIPSEKLFNKKYLGVLARLTTIHADLSSRVYVKNYVNLAIIPEKTVEVHIIKQEKLSGNEESKQDMFYCEVNILEYEVSNWDKLQQQVQECFELVKEIRKYISYFGYSSKQLLGFDKNLTTDINHIINISYFYIEMLYGHIDVNTIKFLEATNLNQRYNQIKESLAKLLIIKHKQHVEEIMSKSHESTTEVNEIPEGYAVIIFDKAIAKFLPLSSRYKELTPDIYMFNSHILTTEQIIQNHYQGKQTILLIKEDFEKHNPNKNTIPSIKAKVINTVCLEDNTAHIRIIPESRVRVTEIVLKDGVFYGKAEEIEELAVSNEEELKLLRILIEQIIVAYTNKPDYDYLGRWYPVYESSKLNIETYAANLSYYLANEILGYDYDTSSDTNLMQEFCSKTTIEKLQYLLDTINSKNLSKPESTQDNNSSTQEIASTVQQEVVSKETKIDSKDVVSNTPATIMEWRELGNAQVDSNESEKALQSFNKALEIDPNDQTVLACKVAVLIYGLKQYQAVIDIYNQHPCIPDILPICSGDAYYGLEKYDEAINYYSKIIVDSNEYIYSRYNIGLAYYKLGNYLESTKSFDEALKLNEQSALAIPKLMNMSVLDSLFHHDFVEDQEHTLKIIEEILINNSQSRSALILKMILLIRLKNYNEALIVSNKLLELIPDIPAFIYYKGNILGHLECYEEALQYIDKAIMLNNSNLGWIENKGTMLFQLEKYQEAITAYDEILNQYPENQKILTYKAYTLSRMGKHDEALKRLEDVLAMDSSYVSAITRKGSVYFEMGNYQEAVKNYDKAIQLGENSSKVIYFREQALEILRKLAIEEDLAYLIENTPLPPTVKIQATTKLNTTKSLNNTDNEKNDHIRYLQNLLKLPWGKYDKTNIDLAEAKKILEQEHYGLEEVKTRILEALVFMTRSTHARPPIICLVGSPGVGKTSIANSVAVALERKAITLSLAGANDSNIIRGCMNFYRGATPGKILLLISEAGTCNPVMVLDEIDKMDSSRGNSLEGALLQLIDPSQNANFTDDYFNFPFDLSKVLFIITANSLDKISYPLLNRMEVIEISGYTEQEKLQIANSYLIPKLLKEADLPIEQFKIDETIIKKLIKHYTKESGVRDIERILRTIVQKYLVDELQGNKPMINLALIEQYLGTAKYQDTNPDKTAKVGIAIGLAYTASGGSTITVEAEKFPGEGKIKATGKLGEVLKESIEAALAYLKANAQQLAIEQQLFKKYDLHLHLPEGAIAKDGPSAGITIFVALASLLSGKKVRQDIAMTGELTLKGRILPIGGLKEKLSAAVRENITTVIIPEGNKRDLAKIPHEIRELLTIKTISHASELLNIVFVNKK